MLTRMSDSSSGEEHSRDHPAGRAGPAKGRLARSTASSPACLAPVPSVPARDATPHRHVRESPERAPTALHRPAEAPRRRVTRRLPRASARSPHRPALDHRGTRAHGRASSPRATRSAVPSSPPGQRRCCSPPRPSSPASSRRPASRPAGACSRTSSRVCAQLRTRRWDRARSAPGCVLCRALSHNSATSATSSAGNCILAAHAELP